MIDKKKLIEELLDCVADATDIETQIKRLTMVGLLMNEVLDEVLPLPDANNCPLCGSSQIIHEDRYCRTCRTNY